MYTHLFADSRTISESCNVALCINPPVRAERVLTREFPWERVLMGLYLTAIDDDGTIRIWYGCRSGKENSQKHTALAESKNGVDFVKRGIVLGETMEGAVYIDPTQAPEKRYGYFGNLYGSGLYRWTSPDGVRFTRDAEPLLAFESDTQNVAAWDAERNEYAAYARGWNIGATKNEHRRTVIRFTFPYIDRPWTCADPTAENRLSGSGLPRFHNESDIVLEADSDDPDDTDIYTMAPVEYGSLQVAFPTFYRHFREPDEGPYINAGCTSVQFAASLDGLAWKRYDRRVYAAPLPGEQMVYMGQGLIHRNDEIWQYGIAFRTHHGEVEKRFRHGDGTMYRFVQRKDGFVSADTAARGTLITNPVEWSAEYLLLNLDTRGIGSVRVGVLNPDGSEITGYGIGQCNPITANSLGARVSWNTGGTAAFRGRRVRLVFESAASRLFSFRFDG